MPRYTHAELTGHIRSLTDRYIAAEFPFSDEVMRASLFAIGLRGEDLREAMREAQEQKTHATGQRAS